MKTLFTRTPLACLALLLSLGTLPVSATVRVKLHREVGIAGAYVVTIEMTPAVSLAGPDAHLVRDGGAKLVGLGNSKPPNYHLTVLVTDNGRPVERANVVILYRTIGNRDGRWVSLPVARMHVAGKGPATTQFGNNVRLAPGAYEVRVSVNGEGAATGTYVVPS